MLFSEPPSVNRLAIVMLFFAAGSGLPVK